MPGGSVNRRAVVSVLVLALLSVGCGTRVKAESDALGNGGLGGDQVIVAGGAGGGGPTASPGGSAAPGAPANGFGSLENPCGPNTGGPNPATGTGVTETEIHVSTIADPGGVKPGLNKGVHDSMKAFADWCNSFGGINGRKLVVDLKDAKLTQYKDMVTQSCTDSLALVGSMAVLDQLGAQDQVDCGLVNVPAAVVSPEAAGADLTVQPMPNPIGTYQTGSGQWVKATFPDAVTKASSLYSKFAVTEGQAARLVEADESIGFKFIYRQSANINETNWGPLVVSMKNQGVKYMTLTSSFEEIVPLQKEMAAQSYHPEVTELETNFYNTKYPQAAKEQGADTTSTYVRLTVWPFEEADQNAAMKQYLAILKKYVPDADPEELGVQAFSAGLLFAQAAKAAGPQLTRESLMRELLKINSWNGGGLHGPSDPGKNVPSTCFIMMKVETGDTPGFTRAYPLPDKDKDAYDKGKGMACPENATFQLKGDYGQGAKKKS